MKKELPNESEQFIDIDKETKEIMVNGKDVKNALAFAT